MNGIFAENFMAYREAGYEPRPVKPGTKAPIVPNWQSPDTELQLGVLNSWAAKYADCGIGLRMGTVLPDGTLLAAVDIDRDDYVGVTRALLRDPICGRIGRRGIVYFVRVLGDGRYRDFKTKPEGGPVMKIGELLCDRRFCVLPPTIHPDTGSAYRWIGRPLLEINFQDLPILETSK